MNDVVSQIAADIFSGHVVLFVGSGYSLNCLSSQSRDKIPSANGLKSILSEELGIDPSDYSLEDICEHYNSIKGQVNFFEKIKEIFTVDQVPEINSHFIQLPWWRIYTTNFDNAIERAIVAGGKQPVTMDLDHSATKDIPRHAVIHLNGSVATANSNNFNSKIRLTASTYWDSRISDRGWLARLHRDISQARSVVFVGYSLFDIDIAKLLRANPEFSKKTFFIDSTRVDPVKSTKLKSFGRVINSGFEAAARAIIAEQQNIQPVTESFFTSFEELIAPTNIAELGSGEARKFYISGANVEDIIFLDPESSSQYLIDRECQHVIIDQIKNGSSRHLIHGKIGNGKSVTALKLSSQLIGSGYRVFYFKRKTERLLNEIEIIKNMGRCAVILENAFGHTEPLQVICENIGSSVAVIATARTAAFELRGSELRSLLGDSYRRYSLDTLRAPERQALATALLNLGFFGRYSSTPDRLPTLIDNWGNDIRSLILKLFEDSDIGEIFKTQVAEASKIDENVSTVLILYFLLVVAEARGDIETADELIELSTYTIIDNNKGLFSDFFDINTDGRIRVRSSVIADYCLRNVFVDDQIIDTLIYVADKQRGKTYADNETWPILQQFMRFGFVEPLLSQKGKKPNLFRYYERLRTSSFYMRRPHFWLQYAIAMMSLNRYDLAKHYLETSRSYADKINNYNYRHLDNHTARYYLESRSRGSESYKDHYVVFLKSSGTIINEFKSNDQQNYSARVCKYMAEFFHKCTDLLSESEKIECKRRISIILNHLKQRNPGRDTNGTLINDAIEALSQANRILEGDLIPVPLRGNDNDFIGAEQSASSASA